jgi:hypothetical protein
LISTSERWLSPRDRTGDVVATCPNAALIFQVVGIVFGRAARFAGHFALETHAAEIAVAIRDFLPHWGAIEPVLPTRSGGGRRSPVSFKETSNLELSATISEGNQGVSGCVRAIRLARGLQTLTELRRFAPSFGYFELLFSRKRLILRTVELEKRPKIAVVPTKGIFLRRDL